MMLFMIVVQTKSFIKVKSDTKLVGLAYNRATSVKSLDSIKGVLRG